MQVAGVGTVRASRGATARSATGGQPQSEDAREREAACLAHAASRRGVAEVLSEVHRACSPYPKRTIPGRFGLNISRYEISAAFWRVRLSTRSLSLARKPLATSCVNHVRHGGARY